ncbi:MAG: hypothetical protein ACK4K9_03935 [Bacteroidia bacterium]
MQVIEFTQEAIIQIENYKKTLMVPNDYALRIGIKQKNASDKGLIIGFDAKTDKDRETEVNGIKIIYNAGQIFFFAGMVIDFVERNGKKGFVLIEKSKNTNP